MRRDRHGSREPSAFTDFQHTDLIGDTPPVRANPLRLSQAYPPCLCSKGPHIPCGMTS